MNQEGLYKVLEVMAEENVKVDYLETNASWFQDLGSCEKIINELKERACNKIMISVCPFHNEFIPLVKMEGVMEACQNRNMDFFIWQEQYYRHLAALERHRTHSFEELNSIWGWNYLLKTGKRYGLTMNGRALDTFRSYLPHWKAEEIIEDNPKGCSELTKTDHFHLDLFGNYIPHGCVGLQIKQEDLGKELPEETYPHYTTLARQGISGLYERTRKQGFIPREKGYVSKCDLCGHIRHFIMELSSGNFKDLGPTEYYSLD
jgi:hypothetical protein